MINQQNSKKNHFLLDIRVPLDQEKDHSNEERNILMILQLTNNHLDLSTQALVDKVSEKSRRPKIHKLFTNICKGHKAQNKGNLNL